MSSSNSDSEEEYPLFGSEDDPLPDEPEPWYHWENTIDVWVPPPFKGESGLVEVVYIMALQHLFLLHECPDIYMRYDSNPPDLL